MWEFFVSDVNNWYSFALGIVIVLGLAEGLGLLFGLSLSALIDNVSPIELDYEMDLDADVSQGGLTQILGWLCLNRLPLMIWLVIFLVSFLGSSNKPITLFGFVSDLDIFLVGSCKLITLAPFWGIKGSGSVNTSP